MKALPEGLIDVAAVAGIYDVRDRWVYEQVAQGPLPYYRVGRYIRFRASELEEHLKACRRGPGSHGRTTEAVATTSARR